LNLIQLSRNSSIVYLFIAGIPSSQRSSQSATVRYKRELTKDPFSSDLEVTKATPRNSHNVIETHDFAGPKEANAPGYYRDVAINGIKEDCIGFSLNEALYHVSLPVLLSET
jgi:hypothetical protein